jgi:hypothetical protein
VSQPQDGISHSDDNFSQDLKDGQIKFTLDFVLVTPEDSTLRASVQTNGHSL